MNIKDIGKSAAKFDALGYDTDKDAYRLTYAEFIAPLIKAVQELDERIMSIENRLDS
jgi:hypothetical protein